METFLGPYKEALAREVQHACSGVTRSSQRGPGCRIFRYLPELVEVVTEVESERIADYDQAVRERICSWCPYQDAEGYCSLRIFGQCCLAMQLPAVVQTIHKIEQTAPAG